MPITLTAPITEAEYKAAPLFKLPDDFEGDRVVNVLNQAWKEFQSKYRIKQPLDLTTNTEIIEFGSRFANVRPSTTTCELIPKYLPLVAVTSVKYTTNITNGWTAAANYNTLLESVMVFDNPFVRGDYGLYQLVYSSGYTVIPDDLKLACSLMAAHIFSGMFFPTQAGSSVLPAWIPKELEDIAQNYKRVR